jgi:hypothetical protein
MAELADALASGASDRKVVQVQVLFPAPSRTVSNVYHARTMQFFDFLELFEILAHNIIETLV